MFAKEFEMTQPAADWLSLAGLCVKMEFLSPWGSCDLVGASLNKVKTSHRLKQKQTHSIGSTRLAGLLLRIPDIELKESTSIDELALEMPTDTREQIERDVAKLTQHRFVRKSSGGRLQKINGWLPLHDRLVAVELKLFRITEAMYQAFNNLGFAEESYVGFPEDVAHRVNDNPARWMRFFDAGVGLLSVTPSRCDVLRDSTGSRTAVDRALQTYCIEKFWRTRPKDSTSSELRQ